MLNKGEIMKKALVLLLCLGLYGYASAGDINSIRFGMSKEDVIKLMGEPESASEIDGTEYLEYKVAETGENHSNVTNISFFVWIKGEKVTTYGRFPKSYPHPTPSELSIPPVEELAKLDYGTPITINYEQTIRKYCENNFKNSETTVYKFQGRPQKYWYREIFFEKDGARPKIYMGYAVFVKIDYKNKMDKLEREYVGDLPWTFVFRDNEIIKAVSPEETIMWEKHNKYIYQETKERESNRKPGGPIRLYSLVATYECGGRIIP